MSDPFAAPFPDDIRDELPDDLDPSGFVGAYQFPDNSRRRWPGVIYALLAAGCLAVYLGAPDSPIVNEGWLLAAVLLGVMSLISITSGWRMNVDEKDALVAAQRAVRCMHRGLVCVWAVRARAVLRTDVVARSLWWCHGHTAKWQFA